MRSPRLRPPPPMKRRDDRRDPETGAPGVDPERMNYLFADAGPRVPARRVADDDGLSATRSALALRLCRLLSSSEFGTGARLSEEALITLESLARDTAVRVRIALAGAIKDIASCPAPVAATLARDVEREVAEPILRCCAALSDDELLAVIAGRGESWALSAVAGRRAVSARISAALVDKDDAGAIGVLLDNEGAVIAEPTMERLIDASDIQPDWGGRIARRLELPRRLAIRLAARVDGAILDTLRRRPDFDEAMSREIATAARRRVDWIERVEPGETQERRAVRLHRAGLLDETAFGDALSWGQARFVRTALALTAEIPAFLVDELLASRDARVATALCWRAGFSMRTAMRVQTDAAGIDPRRVLNARRGTDYPLTPAEMTRCLELRGAPPPALPPS